jgi:hypothetical protein
MHVFLLSACLLASASAFDGTVISQMAYPEDWKILPNEPRSSLPVKITLAVQEQNLDRVLEIAREVSDPKSARYGEFLTQIQLDEMTAPLAEDMGNVTGWLDTHALEYTVDRSNVHVVTDIPTAQNLFDTQFHIAMNKGTAQFVVRAGSFTIPACVNNAVVAVFGLHGLPLPPKRKISAPGQPANVTPTVLSIDYGIKGVEVTRSTKNRQAVAEFQGQFMSEDDLKMFFKQYVPTAKAGDEKVFKFVGEKQDGEGVEALLDIQYIMGVAPGIKTEFWEYKNMDFCLDLFNWTSALVKTEDIPLVHSVSYGWQGNLSQVRFPCVYPFPRCFCPFPTFPRSPRSPFSSLLVLLAPPTTPHSYTLHQVHCMMENANAVDVNFGKLAAKGIAIMISSGDSGSGYVAPHCTATSGVADIMVTKGTVKVIEHTNLLGCCSYAQEYAAKAYTWTPPPKGRDYSTLSIPPTERRRQKQRRAEEAREKGPVTLTGDGDLHFADALFHVAYSHHITFPVRETYKITGDVDEKGGTLKVVDVNGTFADTTMAVGPQWTNARPGSTYKPYYRNATMTITVKGKTSKHFIKMPVSEFPGQGGLVEEIVLYNTSGFEYQNQEVQWEAGVNPPPPPPVGNCTVYTTVEATGPATTAGTKSGGPAVEKKNNGVLWPSWPASSPWVTSVGATRFVGQTIGNEEMATDQFGSGGGFSKMFQQKPDATWQSKAVSDYLSTVDPSTLPPASMFPAEGRATPDVSALGEG